MYLAYAYCKVPVAAIMASDSHRSEMVSQLLFGEAVSILEIQRNNKWARILTHNDGVEGWIITGQLQLIQEKLLRKPNKFISYSHKDFLIQDGSKSLLPYGCDLPHLMAGKFKWKEGILFKGSKKKLQETTSFSSDIINAAYLYLGAPYLWGGRTIMGIDCSGLVQMAYKLCNVYMLRNSADQVSQGLSVDFLNSVHPGDIAFFDDDEGNIIHTGILIDSSTIIHASETSGRVVIDSIDTGGIINLEYKKRTHKLRVIKRIIDTIN